MKMDRITSVSYTRMSDFEKCRYLAKLKYIDRIPEPERPLPKGKTEHAHVRGSRIHDGAELFVRGGVELLPELENFREDYEELRDLYEQKLVELEGEWAVNTEWEPVAWDSANAWCRMKLDAFVRTSDDSARVIDYKTGRRQGNEIKHTEQGQIYQLSTFLRHPELNNIQVEFWYTDLGEKDIKTYTRVQGTAYFDKYMKRLSAVTTSENFDPNPNAFSCKWCPYKGNACEYGVTGVPNSKAAKARLKELRRQRLA